MTTATGPHLTRTHKALLGFVVLGAVTIAGIGFAGSYNAVSNLAREKGFGNFSNVLPIGVDIGIGVLLALDLFLAWLRMAFPLLRQTAWMLTAATIAFNAAAAWPNPIGVGMHAVIPVLFIIVVEAARHAVGRIADITADRHIENPPFVRWLVAFPSTFYLWRRMRKWNIRSYDDAIRHQREVKVYRAQLRQAYGKVRKAPADKRLVLTLASYGMSIAEAIEMPEAETRKRTEAEAKRQLAEAEAEAKRQAAELRVQAEARILAAETEAKLAAIALQQQQAEAEAARAEQQRKDAEAEARRKAEAKRIAAEALRANGTSGSGSGSGAENKPKPKRTSGSGPANLGGARSKRAAEVEAVLALITKAGDPKAVSLEDVMRDFGLKQTTAYDRLSTAQNLWRDAQAA